MNHSSQPRKSTLVGIGLACLLVVIHLVAGFVCHTCFFDIEQPKTRSFHLHSGDDLNPCHHGRNEIHPLNSWACSVMQDDTAFILPEIPQLPIMISFFVVLFLLDVSYTGRTSITAHGRSPPLVLI